MNTTEKKFSGNSVKPNKPEKRVSAGAIQASVWRNEIQKDGKISEYKTISFDRRYKDKKTGEWKSTNSMRITDLPKAIAVLSKVYEYLVIKENDDISIIDEEIVM